MRFAPSLVVASGMAALASVVFLVAPMSRGQTPTHSGKNDSIGPAKARKEVDLIVKDLREARAIALKVGDTKLRDQLELVLGQADLRARNLADDLARAKPAPPSSPHPALLPSPDFDRLLAGLKKESFDAGKLTFLENFAKSQPLNCQQAARLLKCFSFDDQRAKAATLLFPRLVDRQNFHEVLDTFDFETNKANVRRAVGLK